MLLNYIESNRGYEHAFFYYKNYKIMCCYVDCNTDNVRKGWVIEGSINPSIGYKKAMRILKNNLPIKRILKRAIAARMHMQCWGGINSVSLEDINILRDELYKLKS